MTTLGYFVPVLGFLGAKIVLGSRIVLTNGEKEILAAPVAFLPAGIAAWWMFRKLQAYCTRREARVVAIAFAVLAPVSFGMAFLFSEMSGGYAELLLGSPFALVGAFAGVVVMATILNFLLCLFTLRFTRHIVRLESTH
ncbi:MAG: hypothetical protein WBQ43_20795 [Terriglobales bacterium]